jgi:hypothetical protein
VFLIAFMNDALAICMLPRYQDRGNKGAFKTLRMGQNPALIGSKNVITLDSRVL